MKKGFTIVEVSILFVIFLIVAFLVAPLSLDDTIQAKYISRWRNVQTDFSNIFYSINARREEQNVDVREALSNIIKEETKADVLGYKTTFFDKSKPNKTYVFENYRLTQSDAIVAYKFFETPQEGVLGVLLYDVNGVDGPNVWGKDVYGYNIYDTKFEPLGKNESFTTQKQDCSKNGTGLYCSNYYLQGGKFE